VAESGRTGVYGALARVPGDRAGLSYGVHQASLGSGNLFKLVSAYCAKPGAVYCAELTPYLPRLSAKDQALNTDAEIYSLLKRAATDPLMGEAQEDFFFEVFQKPALTKWSQFGFKTALSASVIYDSFMHGNFDSMVKRTNERYGEPTAKNEKEWIAGYVAIRKEWLQTHPNQMLHNTAIRMVALESLIASNNWNLTFPLNLARPGDRVYPLTPYDLGDWLFQDPIHRLGAAQFGVASLGEANVPNGRNRFVQSALVDLGYLPAGIVDGQFGAGTAQAVQAFQKKMSLPQTGQVEGATFDALCRELEKIPAAGSAAAGAGAAVTTSPQTTP
jgi:chitosanase